MRKIALLVASLGLLLVGSDLQAAAKIKVLLITGDDVTPAHNWKDMSGATREVLEATGRFEVKVSETLDPLSSKTELDNYDVIFLTRYNRKGTLSDEAKDNLLTFVKNGKGLAVSHLASASFPEWQEFRKLVGRYWVMGKSGHGPRSVFRVTIAQKDNAIVKEMADFETDDELYAKLEGDAPIQTLATADSDFSKKTEPLVFTLEYGKGRVFHEAFGHDGKAVKTPSVAKIIARGCEWAATGKVEESK